MGNGNFIYTVSGTPTASGSMDVPISFAGATTCNVTKTVAAGITVVMPGNTKAWMKHNLGADTNLNPDTPIVIGLHGSYYQWGRKAAVASSGSAAGAISGWNGTGAPDGSWSDTTKTTNDPCPTGFRVPTRQQWMNLVNSTTRSNTGSWTESATNYGAAMILTGGGNRLTFPVTGSRYYTNGALNSRGVAGAYWSSTMNTGGTAYRMQFSSSNIDFSYNFRTFGFSIRCIAE